MMPVKVLLVDDHQEWQSILLRNINQALNEIGRQGDIRLRNDFNQALNDLQEENWDLLVSDVGLGDRKLSRQLLGKQLAAVARDLNLPCILVSGTKWVTPQEAREFFREYRVNDFFWRPSFEQRLFIASVQEAIQDSLGERGKKTSTEVEIPKREDRYALRNWWHTILVKEGRYDCYAIFLGFPGDRELGRYLIEFQSDLEQIARDNWLILSLSKISFKNLGVYKPLGSFIKDDIEGGHSSKMAGLFNIEKDKLPCLVVFKDIRSENRAVILLGGKTAEEIFELIKTLVSANSG